MPNNSPILTGDISGGVHSTSVDKLKAQPLAGTTPASGQTLTWNGAAWAPATPSTGGGGGANGLTYYLNQGIAPDAPTTGLPGIVQQLGRTGEVTQTTVTTPTLTKDVWTLILGFVSESTPIDPYTTLIPAGLWDFNIWAFSDANVAAGTSIRALAYVYNGTSTTLLGTSASQVINGTSAQYSLSVLVPQTTVAATDRIYIAIEALATANQHTVTAQFGDGTPSHVHTSLPLVGGTGLWRSISGVLQPNGTQISDNDVASDAAIAQSKISGLTTSLAAKADKTTTISAGTGLTGGGDLSANRSLAVSYGTTAGTAAQGNDARLNDSRTPTGTAGGDLSGTYPNPTLATVAVNKGGTGQTSYTNGQLLIGNSTGNTLTKATLTAGANVTITNAAGAITIASSGATTTPTDVQVFTSSGTWTKPTGAKSVHITCIAAGGGGASGRITAGQQGGGGGAGGAFSERLIPASVLGATETVTVGIGGAGGAAVSAANAANNVGTKGGDSLVGTWISAAGGDGGGTLGAAGIASNRYQWQGANAGGGGVAAAGAGGSNSAMAGAGGGGGGGLNNPPTSQFGGGIGGAVLTNGVIGGTSAGGSAGGGNGSNGASVGSFTHCGGGGAGGGSSLASNAGNGGNGGLYGGGGGGGGTATTGFSSGAGGTGANGIVVVTTYF